MDAKNLGAFIAQLRRDKGLTQSALAEQLEVTRKAISRWETGRGYPDIELLPKLAEVLGISVQELLEAKKHLAPEAQSDVLSVSVVCSYGASQRKAQSKKVVWLSVCLAVLVALFFLICIIPFSVGVYRCIIGSDNCVIASDYGSITYYGQKYIPLPMNGLECRIGDCMVQEAQVEGSGFLGKLLFGESLYEVKNVPNYEIVYLQTGYDYGVSEYYVLESEYDRYLNMINESVFDCFYVSASDSQDYVREVSITSSLAESICLASDSCQEIDGNCISLYAYEGKHIFYRWEGDIYRSGDNFYWSPSEYQERTDMHSGYYMSHRYYYIDRADYEALTACFGCFE